MKYTDSEWKAHDEGIIYYEYEINILGTKWSFQIWHCKNKQKKSIISPETFDWWKIRYALS